MRVSSFILPITHPRGERHDPAHQTARRRLLNEFGGYTASPVAGAWRDPETGVVHYDLSLRYDVAADYDERGQAGVTDRRTQLASIVAEVGREARQIAMFVQWDTGDVEFVATGE